MIWVELTFVGVVVIIVGLYWILVGSQEAREQTALRKRLKGDRKSAFQATKAVSVAREEKPLSNIGALETVLVRFGGVSSPIQRMLAEADVNLTPGAFVLMTIAAFLLGGGLTQYVLGIAWISLGGAILGAVLPTFLIRFMRTRRLRKFEEQFPEAIELISRALRAGHAFATGLKMAADEMPDPVGPEFRLLFDRQNYGASVNDALRAFADRIPLIDARFFATAVLTQREAGGNLAEVLDRLAAVMRDRFRVKREIRVKSTHGRITAFVLAGLPPSVGVLLIAISPDEMRLLITDPLGQKMLMVAAGMQIVGTFVVRKLVDLKY